MKQLVRRPALVLTSPLTRARQTAAILTELAGWPKATECAELAPGTSPEELLAALRRRPELCIAVIGHEPGLGRLVAASLPGAPAAQAFRFKKMGAALLTFDGAARARGARLTWLVPAKVLRAAR
jgi:phosphohistidine phosphatase